MDTTSEPALSLGLETEVNRSPRPTTPEQIHETDFTHEAQKRPTLKSPDTSLLAPSMSLIDNPVTLEEPDFETIHEPIDLDNAYLDFFSNVTTPQEDLALRNDANAQVIELSQRKSFDRSFSDYPDHEVATKAQEPLQASSATPMGIIDISDDEDEDEGQVSVQVGPSPVRTPIQIFKRETSTDVLLAANSGADNITHTIELDQDDNSASLLFQPSATNDDPRRLSLQDEEHGNLDRGNDDAHHLPSLAPDGFTKSNSQNHAMELRGPVPENALAVMLRAFTENSANIEEAAKDDGDLDEAGDIDSEEEDARLSATFAKLKAEHEVRVASGEANPIDDVRFRAAVQAESNRKRLRKKQKDLQETEIQEEHSLFFPEPERPSTSTSPAFANDSDDEVTVVGTSRAATTNERKRGYEYLDEISDHENPSEGHQSRGKTSKRGRKLTAKSPPRASTTLTIATSSTRGKGSRGGRRGGGRTGRGRGGKRTKPDDNLFNLTTLLPYDIVGQTARNRLQEAQPELGAQTRRKDALADLIASLPDDQRDLHIGDKKILDDAVQSFTNSRTTKPFEGNFKIKGMKSTLHHYQTIGAAKMREREKEGKPFGGLLGDEMGLGKTVMAIANIIDGRPTAESRARTTLIVAPAVLQQQWYNEVLKHADRDAGFIKNILIWKSSGLQPSDPVAMLNSFDIIITSYHELLRSYPKKEIPLELTTARAKEEWWEKHFEDNKGVLHRIKWHRIVLDEAQAIKNHLSRTSEAAWRLRGKFRWTLSGTPVVNSLEEFFAYFRFLKVWITGDFETWKRNFCKKGSTKALDRLRRMLDKMMIRRTQQDQLFGRPIIQLPPLKPIKTISLQFSIVERALYKIVRDRFVQKIKSFAAGGNTSAHYGSIFVLLLRLRQLTAHILLVQKTLKDLLLLEDLEKLWALTRSDEAQADPQSRAHANAVSEALKTIDRSDARRRSETGSIDPATASVDAAEATSKSTLGLSSQFRECLESMRGSGEWEKANQRSLCSECGHPPVNPHVTSCLHIYCFACLNEIAFAGLLEEQKAATCRECNIKFKICEAYAAQPFTQGEALRSQRGTASRRSRERDVEEDVDWFRLRGPILQSTKTNAAVAQIETWFEEDPENKILLFSQWRGMLKVFSRICTEKDWDHESFHGEMSFDARNKAVERFTTKPKCRILLAAMKAGGVGLNLTAANRVLLIDLWWNVAMETQAYFRVFRIGQTRDVEVVRFAVNNTVDTKMLKMQDRKTEEIKSAMERGGSKGKLTTEELLQLFGVSNGDDGGAGGDDAFIIPDDLYVRQDSDMEDDDGAADELQ